jgi:hypothetical protein
MIRKDQRGFNFTDWQVRQLARNHRSLRQLNRAALLALRRIRSTALTNGEYRAAGDSFSMIATRMVSALRLRQELLIAGRAQPLQLIRVTVGVVCDQCGEKGLYTNPDDHEEANSPEELEQNPAHQSEIESLLELVFRTEERVSVRCESKRSPLRAFFHGISRLTLAVLRQQQEFRETTRKHTPKIECVNSFDNCSVCHKPMKTGDDEDDTHSK